MAMSVMRVPLLSGIILLLSACQLADHSKTPDAATDSHQSELLQHWVTDAAPQLAANPDHYRLQILFTEIQRDQAGRPILRQQQYRADAEYLYPASTVKLAIAALALEYLQQLSVHGVTAVTP